MDLIYVRSDEESVSTYMNIDEVIITEIQAQPSFDLFVSSTSLYPAEIGDTVNTNFTIGTNAGYGDLVISSITSSDADFSVSIDDTVVFGGNIDLDLTWTPSSFGMNKADIIIAHNAASSPDTVSISAEAGNQYIDFDDLQMPLGWQNIDNDNEGEGWGFYSYNSPGYGGSYARSHYNEGGANDWMITEAVLPVSGDSLIFYSNSSSDTDLEDTLHVYVSTGGNAIADFTTEIGEVVSQGYTNIRSAYSLEAYVGDTVYLAIVHHGSAGTNNYSYRKVDDVLLSQKSVDPNPVVALSATNVDFGSAHPGYTLSESFTVFNTGGSDLVITDISSDNTAFTLSASSATINPYGSFGVTAVFAPTAGESYTGNIVITSNAASSPDIITLAGTGYSTWGGPDEAGYLWVSSFDDGGPSFSWIDIDTAGATATDITGDDSRASVVLPFTVEYYGVDYDTITVVTNGWIGMGSNDHYNTTSYSNYSIPNANQPNNIIAPLWDDWVVHDNAEILVKTVGTAPNRQFVVIFNELTHFGVGSSISGASGLVEGGSSCNQEGWGGNYIGINLDYYNANQSLFSSGTQIVFGSYTYFIDAMVIPTNCNSGVALVYIVTDQSMVDGNPWTYQDYSWPYIAAGTTWSLNTGVKFEVIFDEATSNIIVQYLVVVGS